MATDDSFGHSFSISFCEVVDVANDPTQAGQVRVREWAGSGQTDQLSMDDRPWHSSLYPSTNPNLKNIGGPHTGMKVGSKVLALNIGKDKQDRIILGTMVAAGNGTPDGTPTYDSHLPPHAKIQTVGDQAQPQYGDYYFQMQANDTPDTPQTANQQSNPIWYEAQQSLGIGQQSNNALYSDLNMDVVANDPALTVGFPQTG